MSFTVSYDKEDAIVHVKISEPATQDDHLAARDEAFRLCKEHDCLRILVDLRDLGINIPSTMGGFTFGESIAKGPKWARIAHVLPRCGKSKEFVKFISTVEANRGIPTGEFETIEEARRWLLDG